MDTTSSSCKGFERVLKWNNGEPNVAGGLSNGTCVGVNFEVSAALFSGSADEDDAALWFLKRCFSKEVELGKEWRCFRGCVFTGRVMGDGTTSGFCEEFRFGVSGGMTWGC